MPPHAAPSATPAPAPHAAPHAAPSAAPAATVGPDAQVKAYVGALLEDLKNKKTTVESLEARLQQLELEMQARTGDQKPLILATVSEKLGEMSGIAPDIKSEFHGKPPATDIDQLMDRLEGASILFRHKVFLAMKANPDVGKSLGIKKGPFNPKDPFKDRGLNAVFDGLCSEYDLGGRNAGAFVGMVMDKFGTAPPPTDPEGDKRRIGSLKRIIGRREVGKPGAISKMRAATMDKILTTAVQAGGVLALTGGSAGIGLAVLAAKPVFEALTGLRAADFLKAAQEPSTKQGIRNLWDTFKQNTFVADIFSANKTAGGFLKERLWYALKGMIPGSALFDNQDVSVGGYEKEGEIVEAPSAKYKKIEDIMRAACTSIVK
jgi:hypothetical protein